MNGSVAFVQGLYFLLAGLWPLFSIGTFLKITGPKTDLWLVKTVGVILAVIGGGLLVAAVRGDFSASIVLIGVGSAACLTGIDLIYVAKRVISPVYLLDAVVETALILWWFFGGLYP